jgi:hypothetical protein
MFPRIPDALRQHLDWHERMKRMLANPHMDAMAKRLKLEHDHMARAVASLKQDQAR